MNIPPLLPGVVEVRATINATDGAPNSVFYARAELYRYTQAGVYVDEIEEGQSLILTEGGVDVPTMFAVPVDTRYDMTGYRLGIRLKLVDGTTVAGTDTIIVKSEGATLSRAQIPINAASYQLAEAIVTGAVGTASAGNKYYWTSATNVVLSVNLASGEVVNLAKLNNTATNSITAIGQAGWEWTGGDMTNTISAGKSMTFGFLVDAATGITNAYATAASAN
jgi:hypothetical protein